MEVYRFEVNATRNLLSRILRSAVEWRYLEQNSVSQVKLPPRPLRAEPMFLSPVQVRQLLAQIRERYRSVVLVAALTGLRRGELFALRWGAVDLEKGVLEVRESVYAGQFSTPKTRSSVRRIPLSSPLVALLRDRKARTVSPGPGDLVFISRKGTPLRPDNVLKRVIHPA